MSRRKTPPPTTADSVLRSILDSEEYKLALKARLLAGKATAAEIGLARSLGMPVPTGDGDDEAREALRQMDPAARGCLGDLIRMSDRPETAVKLRVIRAGSIVGLGWDTNAVAQDPEPTPVPPSPDDGDLDSLLPPRTAP